MKNKFATILIIVVFIVGLSVMLYPTVSNYINQQNSSKLIDNYEDNVKQMSSEDCGAILKEAHKYNELLRKSINAPKKEGLPGYDQQLNISDNGIMGYIVFQKINVKLPIYHGTGDSMLQSGVGHMSQTSLPVGGESTHAVLTGHRGLPSAKLFTDLDKIVIGDVFYIYVLDQILAYRVDRILVVKPEDTQALQLVKGMDYVTCVTCTPYGVNTHRLLIRGVRVPYESVIAQGPIIKSEATILDPYLVASVLTAPVMLILLAVLLIRSHKVKKHRKSIAKYKRH